jgi:GT2 family glycosyltransferase
MTVAAKEIGVVIIGRNEGARLLRCLASVNQAAAQIVYVDSGSTDGSVAAAERAGAAVVTLDTTVKFTAARARNAGLAHLRQSEEPPRFVQFIDGDCELRADWIAQASQFLLEHTDVAAVCGRRRERYPEASIYNAMIDQEWDTPIGQTLACGGDAMMRMDALATVDGFDPDLIAGEEPELCIRLRVEGWKIWRLDAEMTWHDAALTRFSQWWNRTRRAGHTYAEGVIMHGGPPERHNLRALVRCVAWGVALPVMTVLGALVTPWALLLVALWPLKVVRLMRRGMNLPSALFLTLGCLPEAQGALGYFFKRLTSRQATLIEYK